MLREREIFRVRSGSAAPFGGLEIRRSGGTRVGSDSPYAVRFESEVKMVADVGVVTGDRRVSRPAQTGSRVGNPARSEQNTRPMTGMGTGPSRRGARRHPFNRQ